MSWRGINVDVTIGADGYGGFILTTLRATYVLLLRMVRSLRKPSEGQYFLVGDCVGVDMGRRRNMEGSKYIYIYI